MSPRRNVVAKAGVLRGSGSFAGLVALPPPRSATLEAALSAALSTETAHNYICLQYARDELQA